MSKKKLLEFLKDNEFKFVQDGNCIKIQVQKPEVFLDEIERSVVQRCEQIGVDYSFYEEDRNGVITHHYNFPEGVPQAERPAGFMDCRLDIRKLREKEDLELMALSGLLTKEEESEFKLDKDKKPEYHYNRTPPISDPATLSDLRKRNNPKNSPSGHGTGRCGTCGSTSLWEDHLGYGCNCCNTVFLGAKACV